MPVRDVSFALAEGEMIGIVGESGSGKTLTALAIAGLTPRNVAVRARTLRLKGHDLLQLRGRRLRSWLGTELAFIFQDPMSSLNPALKVDVQLVEAAQVHRSLSRKAAFLLAVRRMREVNIAAPEARLRQHPYEFSGGMVQRTMIAMALMMQPSLIIADEPTTALDVTVQAQIIDILREVNRVHGTAVLLISHDIGVISEVCSRVLVMYAGRIVEDTMVNDMLSGAAHPYTQGLMASVLDMETDRRQPLASIPGRPPALDTVPRGCPYAPRCPVAVARCDEERPELDALGLEHRVACWVAMQGRSDQANR
jgi:oligopeptide/dipeptide ABC transporter ATP-binding protein